MFDGECAITQTSVEVQIIIAGLTQLQYGYLSANMLTATCCTNLEQFGLFNSGIYLIYNECDCMTVGGSVVHGSVSPAGNTL